MGFLQALWFPSTLIHIHDCCPDITKNGGGSIQLLTVPSSYTEVSVKPAVVYKHMYTHIVVRYLYVISPIHKVIYNFANSVYQTFLSILCLQL